MSIRHYFIIETGIRGHNDCIHGLGSLYSYTYSGYSHEGLYALKRGKDSKAGVKYRQKTQTRDLDDSDKKDFLLCASCHYPITQISERIEINERHQHVFANPHGYIFHIGCFAQAPGCTISGEETRYFSWFPGYTWRFALCRQCLTLLGWVFRSKESQFLGLILDRLMST